VILGSIIFNDEFEILDHRIVQYSVHSEVVACARLERGFKMPFLDGHGLYPVAPQRCQGRLHGFIQLVQQVDQVVLTAASLAAPSDLASGSLHGQWLVALGADKRGRLQFHCI
jgi:hypothetical protein